MPRPTLLGLPFSPWTQRARWALNHHAIDHRFDVYLPVAGEPLLRLRIGKLTGRVSVPVLFTPHGAITDSLAIAKHADAIGSGAKLVDGHERAVDRWVGAAEIALDAARSLVLRALVANPAAAEESVSLPLPAAIKRTMARFGARVVASKWKARLETAEAEARIAKVLREVRAELAGRPYIDETFSFADMAIAGAIQAIAPVDDRFIRLGPATRASWHRPELAREFADLVEWRDALFERHHRVRPN